MDRNDTPIEIGVEIDPDRGRMAELEYADALDASGSLARGGSTPSAPTHTVPSLPEIIRQDTARTLGYPRWRDLEIHARPEPCRAIRHRDYGISDLRRMMRQALCADNPLSSDYSGRRVIATNRLVEHLLKKNDSDHLGCFGWVASTLSNPIEVWETFDDQTEGAPFRRYYHSIFLGEIVTSFFVAVGADNVICTAHRIRKHRRSDNLRIGVRIHKSYE